MEENSLASQDSYLFILAHDDRCPLVAGLAKLVKLWDRFNRFKFIGWHDYDVSTAEYLSKLEQCPWSLLLVNEYKQIIYGPDAIPFILKNLPFGKLVAALYILPGTMWLTDKIYMLASNRKHKFSRQLN